MKLHRIIWITRLTNKSFDYVSFADFNKATKSGVKLDQLTPFIFDIKCSGQAPLYFEEDNSNALFVKTELLEIFKEYNIQKWHPHSLSIRGSKKSESYQLFNWENTLTEDQIDFNKTSFRHYDRAKRIVLNEEFRFDNLPQVMSHKKDLQNDRANVKTLTPHKLVFFKQEYNQLDFFRIENITNGYFISERLYAAIENLKYKNIGLELFEPFDIDVGDGPDVKLVSNATISGLNTEEIYTPDFSNLSPKKIDAKIQATLEKYHNYFESTTLVNAISADSSHNLVDLTPTLNTAILNKLEEVRSFQITGLDQQFNEDFEKYNQQFVDCIESTKSKPEIVSLVLSEDNGNIDLNFFHDSDNNRELDIDDNGFYLSSFDDKIVDSIDIKRFTSIIWNEQWHEVVEVFEDNEYLLNIRLYFIAIFRKHLHDFLSSSKSQLASFPACFTSDYYYYEDVGFIHFPG